LGKQLTDDAQGAQAAVGSGASQLLFGS